MVLQLMLLMRMMMLMLMLLLLLLLRKRTTELSTTMHCNGLNCLVLSDYVM